MRFKCQIRFIPSLIVWALLSGCGGENAAELLSDNQNTSAQGALALDIVYAQKFDPEAQQGQIEQYRVTISGSGLTENIVSSYPAATESATIQGLPAGAYVQVTVEYLNSNEAALRRGRSQEIQIVGGQTIQAALTVNNAPIFTNLRDGATVYNTHFTPQVYAPGGMTFEVVDEYEEQTQNIENPLSGNATFSVSESIADATFSIGLARPESGRHILTARDIATQESNSVVVDVLDGGALHAFTTTAGDYIGTLFADDDRYWTNFIECQGRLLEETL